MMKLLFSTAAVAVSGVQLAAQKPELCGQGFESLNPGSQEYFGTLEQHFWTHPGNSDAFSLFKDDLECWYAKLLDDKCGGLAPVDGRKKDLLSICKDPAEDWLAVWKLMTKPEFTYFKTTFPNDLEEETNAEGVYSETMSTMHTLNKKEVLCTTLSVIDDECVKHKYVRTE